MAISSLARGAAIGGSDGSSSGPAQRTIRLEWTTALKMSVLSAASSVENSHICNARLEQVSP